MKDTLFQQVLKSAFLEWQVKCGEPKDQVQFAEHLGISASLLSLYLNGHRQPRDPATIDKLVTKVGPRVLVALNMVKRDPILRYIMWNFHKLDDKTRQSILELGGWETLDMEEHLDDSWNGKVA